MRPGSGRKTVRMRGLAGYWGKVPRQKVEKSSHNVTPVTNCHQHRIGIGYSAWYSVRGIICSAVICDAGDSRQSRTAAS